MIDFYKKLKADVSQLYKINKIVAILSLFLLAFVVAFLIVLFSYLNEFFYVYPLVDTSNINYALFGINTPELFTCVFISFCIVIIVLFSLCFLFSIVLVVDSKNFHSYTLGFKKHFILFWFFLIFPFFSWYMYFELRSKIKKVDSDIEFIKDYDFKNDAGYEEKKNFDVENFINTELTEEEKNSEIIKEAYELYKKGLISHNDFLKIWNESKVFK